MATTSVRYTAGRVRTDLRRIMRQLDSGADPPSSDRRLAALASARSLQDELQRMIDQTIIVARRNEPVVTWREIGDALGVTGQAAAQYARAHGLAVDPVKADDYGRLVAQARQLRQAEAGIV
ncbi:hypothetical protein ACFVWG_14025 [Kribbella sp. NPDC058245]|uniref:hypothetical protein n=1 Tax=Kribbella sp. NPDC058245 TaxID=3346399 RepID=UPI0036E6E1C7